MSSIQISISRKTVYVLPYRNICFLIRNIELYSLPLWPLLKNEFGDANKWLGVVSPSFIIVSASINFVDIGLVVSLVSSDEKVFLFVERLLGIYGLALEFVEFVVVVVVDKEGVLVEKIWLDDDE